MKVSDIGTSSTWSAWRFAEMRAANATAFAEAPMEHRWGQRKRCCARVRVSAGAGAGGTARLRDVSLSGAFLETSLRLPLFSQVAIAVLSDFGSTHARQFTASVVRSESDGIGIEWCDPVSGSICQHLGCTLTCAAARLP